MKRSLIWTTILTASAWLCVVKPVVAAVLKDNEPVVGALRANSPIYRFTDFWESGNPVRELRGEEHLFGANAGDKVLFDFRAEVRGFNPVFAIFDPANRQVAFSQHPYFTFVPPSSGYYKIIVMSQDPSTVPNRYLLRAQTVSGPPARTPSLPPENGSDSGLFGAPPLGETPFSAGGNFSGDGGFLGPSARSTVSTDGGNFFNSPGGFDRPQNSSNSTGTSPAATGQNCRTYPAGTVMFGSAMAARYYTYCLLPAAVFPTAIPAPSNAVTLPRSVNNSLPLSPANPASTPAGADNGRIESGGTTPANPGNFSPPSQSEFYPY
ncbi:MAG: hypothetical protein ACRC62_00995 [Microcoleus sp.]